MRNLLFILLVFVACQNEHTYTPPVGNEPIMPLPYALTPSQVIWVDGTPKEGDTIWVWKNWSYKYRKRMIHVGKTKPHQEFYQQYIYQKIKP